jgi:hypothetical protein
MHAAHQLGGEFIGCDIAYQSGIEERPDHASGAPSPNQVSPQHRAGLHARAGRTLPCTTPRSFGRGIVAHKQ